MAVARYAVVIVTYNRERLLRECIENVGNQTASPDSIIIVNNASTDGTQTCLEELSAESTVYDIINLSQNIGGAGGFSKGIERAVQKDIESVLLIDDDAMQSALILDLQNPLTLLSVLCLALSHITGVPACCSFSFHLALCA